MENLFSKENIKYSFIFILLSIIFLYYVRGPLLDSFLKTEIAKEINSPIIIPSNLGEFLFWLILTLTFTPYIIFIYKRKYEIFILGFFIPSLIINIYTYCTTDNFSLDPFYIEWFFLNLIPAFILVYLLRISKTLKEELISIVFFVFLSRITHIISWRFYYGFEYPSVVIVVIVSLIFFVLSAAIYLIFLSFAVEKIAKIKIFRHGA